MLSQPLLSKELSRTWLDATFEAADNGNSKDFISMVSDEQCADDSIKECMKSRLAQP